MDDACFWTWDPRRLRSELARSPLDVSDLAVATGISRWSLYKYSAPRGARVPAPAVAAQIAEALGIDTKVLYQQTQQAA